MTLKQLSTFKLGKGCDEHPAQETTHNKVSIVSLRQLTGGVERDPSLPTATAFSASSPSL